MFTRLFLSQSSIVTIPFRPHLSYLPPPLKLDDACNNRSLFWCSMVPFFVCVALKRLFLYNSNWVEAGADLRMSPQNFQIFLLQYAFFNIYISKSRELSPQITEKKCPPILQIVFFFFFLILSSALSLIKYSPANCPTNFFFIHLIFSTLSLSPKKSSTLSHQNIFYSFIFLSFIQEKVLEGPGPV
jgi:hypothetical protein